jgi:hypothetical protein
MLRHIVKQVSSRSQISRSYCSNTRQIFDRQSKKKQRDRTALLDNSKDFDYLREEIATSLLDRLDVRKLPSKIQLIRNNFVPRHHTINSI